ALGDEGQPLGASVEVATLSTDEGEPRLVAEGEGLRVVWRAGDAFRSRRLDRRGRPQSDVESISSLPSSSPTPAPSGPLRCAVRDEREIGCRLVEGERTIEEWAAVSARAIRGLQLVELGRALLGVYLAEGPTEEEKTRIGLLMIRCGE